MTSHGLKRQLGLSSAILLGLGSILGTGVFVSIGLSVGVAGNWALGALGIATFLAMMNALSSAQLAANHPVSGGTYAYGYRYLRPEIGFVAGLAFLLAKSASAAAAAIGLVSYLAVLTGWEAMALNWIAAGVVVVMTGLVAGGLRRANLVNTLLVTITLGALVALIVTAVMAVGGADAPNQLEGDWGAAKPASLIEAAALLFVAFTGYGRIATLGEEVKTPRRTIPGAIITTLLVTGMLYFGVLASGLAVLGEAGLTEQMQTSPAPLQAIAGAIDAPALKLFLSVAAITAMAGVLLNLLLGLSRVAFAMGRQGDAPSAFGRVSARNEPLVATVFVGLFIAVIALFGGLFMVWSFSAFTVLIYYAITNLAALQLSAKERLYSPIVPVLGLVGCVGLAVGVTGTAIFYGGFALGFGLAVRWVFKRQVS